MSKYSTQILAIGFLAVVIAVAILAPLLPIADPVAMDVLNRHAGFSARHWLGGDEFGRDTLSRIIFGARASLSVSMIAALLGGTVGVILGLIGGYFRGWLEILAMRPLDIILSFPPMLLALLTVALIGPGTETLTVLLAILFVPAYARVTYGEVLSVRTLEYVEAARALGHRSGRILFRTILPNVIGPILVQFSLVVASCILLESGLSFLGLGVVPPDSSWGVMIRGARPYMYQAPMQLVWPCVALILTIYSINRVCDLLRDRLDPKASVPTFQSPSRFRSLRNRPLRIDPPSIAEGKRLEVKDLVVEISTPGGVIRALDGVSLSVEPGQTVALVGESGSGKSMTGLAIMQLLPSRIGRIADGRVLYSPGDRDKAHTIDLSQVPAEKFRSYRGREIGMVFQEPMACLNPVYTIGFQLEEALLVQREMTRDCARRQAEEELRRVGIPDPARRLDEYPHQLSGGMRQRVAIAIALCGRPKLLIADEPTTALDVTVQAQILTLLDVIRKEQAIGMIFITHNLGVVAEVADRVVVMYCGQPVEQGTVDEIFYNPRHPYTRGLLASVPRDDESDDDSATQLISIPGAVPSPTALPPGCRFAPRCVHAVDDCNRGVPLIEAVNDGHEVRCIRWRDI
ncbi:peptide/nickel transport system permease protein [Bradyrhizobium sp. cir1]|uniref:dipeptide/oligopeptide/nickel ABC transporter permease/ATP-binding protein n=1 Tax=Bradyrhizobium sp. cir1 TaxID=1445730 RepID=UPI001606C781|nr:dipeptide/oligopeptide/nickel ABC transporter permease/ATP-binding protein [Bradyrhizobium sp. cir1]MBB4368303.1 peptide/nickel transport system permease protein [Bradyrhizobium sp. cir1]